MHILYPIGTFYPAQSGGPSNSVYWLAKAMVTEGATVTVVSTDTDQPASTLVDQWLDTDAGRIMYCTTRHHTLPLTVIRQSLRILPTADIVHLTSLFYPTSLVVGLVALWHGKKVVWSPRGELAVAALLIRPTLKKQLIRLLGNWKRRIIFHATSGEETASIRQTFGADTQVIQLANFLELPSIEQRAYPTPPYLLYLGRLHPIKALDNLLEAIAQSQAFRRGGWQLRLVGPDTDGYGNTLRTMATELGLTDLISWERPVDGLAKERLIANAHALVLPSHSENFGNVVVEALAQGTPVIASTGTPWQVLETNKAGLWIPNTPEQLCEAINYCVSLPIYFYTVYRRNALMLAKSGFDIQNNRHHWLAAYDAVLTGGLPLTVCVE